MSWTDYVEATLTSMCCQAALWRTCTYVRMYIRTVCAVHVCMPKVQCKLSVLTCFVRE